MKSPLGFNPNTFEHDYILRLLGHYQSELKTDKEEAQVTDKYAVQLTAFMKGQILQAVKYTLELPSKEPKL